MIVVALGVAAVWVYRAIRVRRGGDDIGPAVHLWRAVSRELQATVPGRRVVSALNLAAWLCFVPFVVTGWLGLGALDEDVPPSPGAAAFSAVVVAVASLVLWWALRWWLGLGQPRRFLTSSRTLGVYLLITGGLMVTSIAMAVAQVTSEPAWLTVTILHFALIPAAFVPIVMQRVAVSAR
ncbi:hypothetical protein [Herbidospora daliensis]|uniref:hypothetical protein n=1 Tax=Herbidospora daliensis TaxID=295585 RepID=UPI000781BDC0|nr:hypothetical protein [Herbidospora daliensis]